MAVTIPEKPVESPTLADCCRAPGSMVFFDRGLLPHDPLQGRVFHNPVSIVSAEAIDEVPAALDRVEQLVDQGHWAAGYIAYEAGAAFESRLPQRSLNNLPYLWFAIYGEPPEPWRGTPVSPGPGLELEPGLTRNQYTAAVTSIREWIAAGDTYQLNFTFPMRGHVVNDSFSLVAQLAHAQRDAAHRAFLNIGSHRIATVSPELFFRLDGDRIVMRPMKGTARRHPDPLRDPQGAEDLRNSPKERAENLMIVDLLRNDLGRIAETGSVHVERLFELERYQTLWTMTSTIAARTGASVPEIFAALFPSGSVTGAPKIRTMQLIHELERHSRGVYCGAIGWWAPNRTAEFNVAIRTLVLDNAGHAAYHVGSGITWDSDPQAEYDECLLKASVLHAATPAFELLESLRLENGAYWLLDRHLNRLEVSANYFGFPFDRTEITQTLTKLAATHPEGLFKARLLLAPDGTISAEAAPIDSAARVRLALARQPVDTQSAFVYNKTTHRSLYTAALAGQNDVDDVILVNSEGHLTESTRANLVLELDGRLYTPPRTAGLLPGTFRQALLDEGTIYERSLAPEDLRRADRVHLINSVRGWIDVTWQGPPRD